MFVTIRDVWLFWKNRVVRGVGEIDASRWSATRNCVVVDGLRRFSCSRRDRDFFGWRRVRGSRVAGGGTSVIFLLVSRVAGCGLRVAGGSRRDRDFFVGVAGCGLRVARSRFFC